MRRGFSLQALPGSLVIPRDPFDDAHARPRLCAPCPHERELTPDCARQSARARAGGIDEVAADTALARPALREFEPVAEHLRRADARANVLKIAAEYERIAQRPD